MATRWESFPIKFQGGLTTNLGRIEQGLQAPGSATFLQNFEPDVQEGYTRILGYQKFSDTEVTGTGQVIGVIAVGGSEVLAVRDGVLQFCSGLAWTNKLSLTSSVGISLAYDSFNFNGDRKFVILDSVNDPIIYNSVSKVATYLSAPPTEVSGAYDVSVFKNHIFYSKENLLSFCAPFDETDFTPANGAGTINVGDKIVGTIVFRDQLIIFCLNSIYRLAGSSSSDFALDAITRNTGCLARDTIQEVGGDILYLGPDGIRYLSATDKLGDFGLARASEKIQKPLLANVSVNSKLSSITIANKNQYRIFSYVSNVGKENSVGFLGVKFIDQTSDGIAWSSLKGLKVYSVSKFQEVDKENIFFSSDTGYIYRMESGNSFDGGDIEAIFETPYMPISDSRKRKTVYKHALYVRPRGNMSITCRVKFDYDVTGSPQTEPFSITNSNNGSSLYGDPNTVYGSSVYGSTPESEYYDNINGSGFVIALRYKSLSQDPPFNLNFVVLEFRENERR